MKIQNRHFFFLGRTFFWFTLVSLSAFFLVRLYYHLTDDFRIGNITYPLPWKEEWDFPITQEEVPRLAEIFEQNFYYLGKGAQVYAFGSGDGKYVIKFFKFKHLKPSFSLYLLPSISPFRELKTKSLNRKDRKLQGVFYGHAVAFKYDKIHSGLLYLHLNPTDSLGLQVKLIDKLGFKRIISLDPIPFVIQKRGETLRTVLSNLLEKKDVELAAFRANQILDMYLSEYQNGVWDRDHGISHNTGFMGDVPFHLDVGKFSFDERPQPKEFYANDLKHVAFKIKEWVRENYPSFSPSFEILVENHLQRLLSENF